MDYSFFLKGLTLGSSTGKHLWTSITVLCAVPVWLEVWYWGGSGGHRGEEGQITWGSQQLSSGDTSERLGTEEKCDQMLILKGLFCFKNSVDKGVEAGGEVSATELISTCLMFPASKVSVHFAFPPAMYESSLVNTWCYQSLTVAFWVGIY